MKDKDHSGKPINLKKPSAWDVRRLLENMAHDAIDDGPGDNHRAAVRALKIVDAIRAIDDEE